MNNEENVYSNNEIKNTNRYECQICGALFEPNKANRYLAVEKEAPIMAVFTSPVTYECFDCRNAVVRTELMKGKEVV